VGEAHTTGWNRAVTAVFRISNQEVYLTRQEEKCVEVFGFLMQNVYYLKIVIDWRFRYIPTGIESTQSPMECK